MNREPASGDLDRGVIDDRIAEARERIGRIESAAGRRAPSPCETEEESIMDDAPDETAAEKARAEINDVLGLPPGDQTPHGRGRPARDADAPHGSLTADDAKGVPLPGSSTDSSREAK